MNTRVGSDLYARYWIRTLNWGYATTDSALARTVFAPSCSGCSRFLSNIIDGVRAKGEHFSGGHLFVSNSEQQPVDAHLGATAVVDLTVDQSVLKVVDARGRTVETTKATHGAIFRHWLKWSSDHWVLVDWKQVVSK